MSREWRDFLDDMLQYTDEVLRFTSGSTLEEFEADSRTMLAVQRALEIIGEAAKQIPPEVQARHPSVDWRGLAGFRDVLSHAYFRLDTSIIWDAARNKLPALREDLVRMIQSEAGGSGKAR